MLKGKRFYLLIFLVSFSLFANWFFLQVESRHYYKIDSIINDSFHKNKIELGKGIEKTSQISYLYISDSTYESYLKSNSLDRKILGSALSRLDSLEVEYIALDLILPYPSDTLSDLKFKQEIQNIDNLFLPVAFSISQKESIANSIDKNRLQKYFFDIKSINEKDGSPLYVGANVFTSIPMFSNTTENSGHINIVEDDDNVVRESILLLKKGDKYIPSLAFAIYLNYMEIEYDDIFINWGKEITLSANNGNMLNEDQSIPIDNMGRTYIPFTDPWGLDFSSISFEKFMKYYEMPGKRGELFDEFSGKIIFIGDVSTGSVDLFKIPISGTVPLIMMHSAMLNSFLTGNFFSKIQRTSIFLIVVILILVNVSQFYFYYKYPILNVSLFTVTILFTFFISYMLFLNFIIIPVGTIVLRASLSLFLLFMYKEFTRIIDLNNENYKQKFERKKYLEELQLARKMQVALLPETIPENKNFLIYAKCIPATEVSGDFYDFIQYENKKFGILTADVTGKGMQGAIMGALSSGIFWQAISDGFESNDNLMSSISDTLYKRKPDKRLFVAVSLGIFDFEKKVLTFYNCGQPKALHLSDEKVVPIESKSPKLPWGVIKTINYNHTNIPFRTGDIFLFYSDGINETMNSEGEQFGVERINEILYENKSKSPGEIADAILSSVNQFKNTTLTHDDITLIIIKLN